MKTVSLETAKQLKALGFPQKTNLYWGKGGMAEDDPIGLWIAVKKPGKIGLRDWVLLESLYLYKAYISPKKMKEMVAAPTAEELLDILPNNCVSYKHHLLPWCVMYKNEERGFHVHRETALTLAEAAGRMWIYLKEHDLLSSENEGTAKVI